MGKVQTFDKPKKVSQRDKLLGASEVGKIVAMRYADKKGYVDERLCLVMEDGNTVLAFPKTQFEVLEDSPKRQLLGRLNIMDTDVTPDISSIDVMDSAEEAEVSEDE